MRAHLAAVSAHLVTAERYRRIEQQHGVDPHRAGAQHPGQLVPGADVPGPDAPGQTVFRVVGPHRDLVQRVEGQHTRHRPEDLLPRHPHIVADIGEDGRLHEIALREFAGVDSRTAGGGAHPLGRSDREIVADPVQLLSRHQRADLGLRIDTVADLQRSREIREPVDEFVVDRPLDEDPGSGTTGLAGIREHAHPSARNRLGQIGVREHDIGGLAAQFHRHPLEGVRGGTDDLATHRRRSGERDLVHPGVHGEGCADALAVTGHDVHHTVGNADLTEQFAEAQRGQTCLFGGFEHEGASGRQHRCEFPDGVGHRAVPRHDRGDHTDGFLDRVTEHRAGNRIRKRLAVDLGGPAGVVPQHLGFPGLAVGAAAAQRCAHIQCFEQSQFVEMLLHLVGERPQQCLAIARGERPPRARDRFPCRGDRMIGVGGIGGGEFGDDRTGGGIDAREGLSRSRFLPPAADQQTFGPAVEKCGELRVRSRTGRHGNPS